MVTLDDIRKSREAVYRVARRTPTLRPESLSKHLGVDLYLKAECLQRTGSFKVRGAANKLASLTEEERARGVIAASAGNHAQGVAVAAAAMGVEATVVMPEHATLAKLSATRSYGANVVQHGSDFGAAVSLARQLAEERDLVFVSAFDDEQIITGQGTLGLELIEECPMAETIIVPVGGGGLISGIATALKAVRPEVKVIGVQSAAAPAAALSLQQGRSIRETPGPTLADGVAIPEPGALTLEAMQQYVDAIVTVDEEAIAQAIVLILERTKLIVEGAGALGVAALLSGAIEGPTGCTAVVLSGGNIDINVLASIVQHGLLLGGRYLTLTVGIDDRPGSLAALLTTIANTGANVLDVTHSRQSLHVPLRGVEVRLLLETRDTAHIDELSSRLVEMGYVLTSGEPTSRIFRPPGWPADI